MNKIYDILLDSKKIGTTLLEKADAPMGVVTGLVKFIEVESGYAFLKKYCIEHKVKINTDDPEYNFIDTTVIPNLRVQDLNRNEIAGQGNYITGFDSEGFEVTILGIPYPFYEKEFPHHVKDYENQFDNENDRNTID